MHGSGHLLNIYQINSLQFDIKKQIFFKIKVECFVSYFVIIKRKVSLQENSAICLFLFVIFSCSLTESPFKVHLEKLSLRQKKLDEDLQLYQTSLELKLKHSTVHVDELCPLIVPNPGVAIIHDYADWVKEASGDLLEPQSKYGLYF